MTNHSASETRTALIHAAMVCFAEHGYPGASMRMIAQEAKRPLSLLFHHFGSKEGLYLEVFKYLMETTLLNSGKGPFPPGGQVPRNRTEAIQIFRETLHFLYVDVARQANEYGAKLLLQEIRAPRPELIPLLSQHALPITRTLQNCLRLLRPELDEARIAFLGASIMGAVISHDIMLGMNAFLWGDFLPAGTPFQGAEWLVDLHLNGLLYPEPTEGVSPRG